MRKTQLFCPFQVAGKDDIEPPIRPFATDLDADLIAYGIPFRKALGRHVRWSATVGTESQLCCNPCGTTTYCRLAFRSNVARSSHGWSRRAFIPLSSSEWDGPPGPGKPGRNVGVGYREPRRIETEDGLPHVFVINVMAPYVLTCLMERPARLVYLSSGMHQHAHANLGDALWTQRRWDGSTAYAESKLLDVLLAFAVARLWPSVLSNSREPRWVPTRMGGPGAPDDTDQAPRTQAWLAVSDDPPARVTGQYFYHMRPRASNPEASDTALQDRLLDICQRHSGTALPL